MNSLIGMFPSLPLFNELSFTVNLALYANG
jgi:hypothetical protein